LPHLLYLMPPFLLMYVCAHDTVFIICFLFGFIDTRVLVYACHLVLILPLVGQLFNSPGPACPDARVWTVVDSLLIRVAQL